MLPEDRLDTLLSLRVAMRRGRSEQSPTYGAGEAGAFQPLLDAADRVAELGDNEPSRDFVAHLEALFLARAAYLRERDGAAPLPLMHDETALPILDPPPFLGHDAPTLPSIEWAAARDDTTEARTMPRWRPNRVAQRQTVWRRLLWPALAAMLLLAIGMSTLTAAAAAGPGSPLYGLRRWEQNIQLTFAGSAADRVRLHITYAQDALSALDATVASRQTGATYEDALATFRDEARAAMTNLNSVPAGGERDALSSQLQRLLAHGTTTLHSALAMLQWPQRIEATGVLGEIGDNVLIVTQASMVYAEHGQRLWTITVTGSGFQQGAGLLVNGKPVSATVSVTPTTLVARMVGDDSAPRPDNIGVANPDNTAAVTTSVTSHEENDDDATPGAQQTPGSDDHGGDGGHGGSGSSGGSATPTGTVQRDH